jgi:hypothetical protein
VHLKNGHTKPSEHTVVKQVAEAARRILAKPKSRKTPLSALHVKNIIRCLEGGLLGDLQVAALIALGFYRFLQWDDRSHITPEDLIFAPTHLSISLPKRKNDQFREGSQVLIARSDDGPCPVGVVENFWHRRGMIRRPRFGYESSTQEWIQTLQGADVIQ